MNVSFFISMFLQSQKKTCRKIPFLGKNKTIIQELAFKTQITKQLTHRETIYFLNSSFHTKHTIKIVEPN